MSLSAWERQTLNSIRDQLADSDPQLTALLISFTELASGERCRPGRRSGRVLAGPSSVHTASGDTNAGTGRSDPRAGWTSA